MRRGAQSALLLSLALLLGAQTIAFGHQHDLDTTDIPCVVCHLAKADTVACGPAIPDTGTGYRPASTVADHVADSTRGAAACYQPRAPPRA